MELAAIAAVLTAMGGVLKLALGALEKQRQGFEHFLDNHLSKHTEALEALTRSVDAMADRLEGRQPPYLVK